MHFFKMRNYGYALYKLLCRANFNLIRVGRFLPEPANLMLNHRLYRGLDERDGAEALRLGVEYDFETFEIFNVSSGSPFEKEDLIELKNNPLKIIAKHFPEALAIYQSKGWSFPVTIDRVYRCDKAFDILGYKPKYTFKYLLKN